MEDKLASLFRRVRRIQALVLLGDLFTVGIEEQLINVSNITEFFSTLLGGPYREYFEAVALADFFWSKFAGRAVQEYFQIVPSLKVIYDAAKDHLHIVSRAIMVTKVIESLQLVDVNIPTFTFKGTEHLGELLHIEIKILETIVIYGRLLLGILPLEIIQIVEIVTAIFKLISNIEMGDLLHILITIPEPLSVDSRIVTGMMPTESIIVTDLNQLMLILRNTPGINDYLIATVTAYLIETLKSVGRVLAIPHIVESITVEEYNQPVFTLRRDTDLNIVIHTLASATSTIIDTLKELGRIVVGVIPTEILIVNDINVVQFILKTTIGIVDVISWYLTGTLIETLLLVGRIVTVPVIEESMIVSDVSLPLSTLRRTIGIDTELTYLSAVTSKLIDPLLSVGRIVAGVFDTESITIDSVSLPILIARRDLAIGELLSVWYTFPALIETMQEMGRIVASIIPDIESTTITDINEPGSILRNSLDIGEDILSETVWVVAKVSITPLNSPAMIM